MAAPGRGFVETARLTPPALTRAKVLPAAPSVTPFAGAHGSAAPSSARVEPAAGVSTAVLAVPSVVAPSPPSAEAKSRAALSSPRRASLAPLAAWSQPGLCSTAEDAQATRDKLTTSFRRLDGEGGQLYLDPRLPEGVESAVLPLLAQAQTVVEQQLGLHPKAPSTYVYFDQQLMKAAACINEDVVAFYDGALHLVANRDDLRQSVTHELTHHALFSSGLSGPAWAQEGIAMLVARETWWRTPARLQALARMPFSPEQMDSLIPYKLPSEQAVGFYVQSALTVQCVLDARGWSLRELANNLRTGTGPDSISYDLPELQSSSFVVTCLRSQAEWRPVSSGSRGNAN